MTKLPLTLLTALVPASMWCAPISVTEPPDFPASGGPTYVLDVGTNTISGTVNGCNGCAGTDYQDNFSLNLPAGLTATSGFLNITNFTFEGGVNPQLGCFTNAGCFGTGYGSGMSLANGTTSFTATSSQSFAPTANFPIAGSFNYTLSFDVSSTVPEPGSFLVIPALAGIVLVGRRFRGGGY